MLSEGIEFLRSRQGSDGLWRDFVTLAGEGADWPTGFIAMQLALAGMERTPLDRAADALAAIQHDDGGWGYHAGVPTDADSTAWVLLLLATLRRRKKHVRRAAACLARHQNPDSGGLPTYLEPGPIRRFMGLGQHIGLDGWCSAHVEVTATGGRAFAAVGGGFRNAAAAAWNFIRSRQREDGCWQSYWWVSPHFPTLQAVELACAVGDTKAAERAADWARRELLGDVGRATLTSAFLTALSLSLLASTGARGPALSRAVERLDTLQDADGGWPSHAEMRIPPPGVAEPHNCDSWRIDGLGTGVVIHDQHRLFTSAACVAALARSGSA